MQLRGDRGAATSAASPPPAGSTDLPVLVVDDDAAVRALFVAVLDEAGIAAIEASDGRAALDIVADRPVSAVLLDSQMPVMGGLETVGELRARPENDTLPIVLVTGRADVSDRVAGLEAGADDYLVKPVEPEELVARVRAQLRAAGAWSRVLDGHLRERTAVARALRRATSPQTPEDTAAAICRELAGLHQSAGVALLAFSGDDRVVTLAAAGPAVAGLRNGAALPPAVGGRLRERARSGPWIDPRGTQVLGTLGPPAGPGGGTTRGGQTGGQEPHLAPGTAFAPVGTGGEPRGLLLVAADSDVRGEDPMQSLAGCLATAIDFATVADALLGPALAERDAVETRRAVLAGTLERRAYAPVFQPILDLEADAIVGYELLTRFADGVPPQQRFAEAAEVGLGPSLERATMSAGIAAAFRLPEETFLAVNVSPALLLDPSGLTLAELARAGDRPLVLELTEHDPIDDYPAVLQAVDDLGVEVRLSVDDAGAGYACLHHILALSPAFVKLDRGWVEGIDADPARQALVAGLCYFASRTGSTLIAEGIETAAELLTLRELGVELGQGFLLGRPQAVRSAAARVSA